MGYLATSGVPRGDIPRSSPKKPKPIKLAIMENTDE